MPRQRKGTVLDRSTHGERSRALHSEGSRRSAVFFVKRPGSPLCRRQRCVSPRPAVSAGWTTLERGSADVPIDTSGITGREAMVRGMLVQDGLSMDVTEEGGRVVRREFVVA